MYDFRNLSPLDFEELVRDLLQEEMKIRIESFGPGADGGVDLRFANGAGKTIVQAKHFIDGDTRSLVRAVKRENAKIAALQANRYMLATSKSLTPGLKQRLIAALTSVKLAPEDCLGRSELNNLLTRHPKVERNHFKLWLTSTEVLQRVLHAGIYNRTESELETIARFIPKFVHNDSVKAAEAILDRAGTLIITGQPGVGKTTLARMLIWLHAANDWEISVIDDIKEAFEISGGEEKRLIFFDDFLGQVKLSDDVVRGADQRFPPFFQRVRLNKNLRFILTSRDYILRQAQSLSQRLGGAEMHASEMVLNVGVYTRPVRARMLFNHLFFADLAEEERLALLEDDFFLKIIDHRNFNPRLISVLTVAEYVSMAGRPIRETVQAVLDNPQELWERPYRTHITPEGRALMLALLFNEAGVSLIALERSFRRMVKALDLRVGPTDLPNFFRTAVKELEGSVLSVERRQAGFSNPGVRDFLTTVVRRDELMPAVLDVIGDYDELNQAWVIFSSFGTFEQRRVHPSIKHWAPALARVLEDDTGSAFEQFLLALQLYEQTRDEAVLPLLRLAIDRLAEGGVDGDELNKAAGMLEEKSGWDVELEVADSIHVVLTIAVAKSLEANGGAMSIDDLESAATALLRYGAETDGAQGAVSAAVTLFLGNIREPLSDINSVDELDEFERQVRRIALDHGHFDEATARRFETRREQLEEREAPASDYRSTWSKPEATSNDDEIRSMFSALRKP